MGNDSAVRAWAGIGILASGALFLALLIGAVGVTSAAVPLVVGLAAVVGGLVGRLVNVLASGLVLTGWAAGLLILANGAVPGNREGAVLTMGLAIGFLLAVVATKALGRPDVIGIAGLTGLTVGLGYYFAFQMSAVGGWAFWAVIVLVWAAWEAVSLKTGLAPSTAKV